MGHEINKVEQGILLPADVMGWLEGMYQIRLSNGMEEIKRVKNAADFAVKLNGRLMAELIMFGRLNHNEPLNVGNFVQRETHYALERKGFVWDEGKRVFYRRDNPSGMISSQEYRKVYFESVKALFEKGVEYFRKKSEETEDRRLCDGERLLSSLEGA
jgi:hypothetical protein